MLLDTKILIYSADPADSHCLSYVEREDACIASVTRIEVPGFPRWSNLPGDRARRLEEIVASMIQLQLNDAVIHQAILLRQQRKMTLGDSIIAATALDENLALVTRNLDDFKHIAGLKLINPFDAS
jgi:predicted nucleic acid-binding protein